MEGVEMQLIDPYPLFHGNSSKLWVINKVTKEGVNYSARKLREKDVIIFFENGNRVYMQPLNQMGQFPKKVGSFSLNQEKNRCEIKFKDQLWSFYMVQQDNRRLFLRPTEDSDFEFELELITYPLSH